MTVSPLVKYRIPIGVASWLTFVISLIFYWITVDPGASFWDSPEYVTVASKLEIGHPPGNPIWMLAMRVVTIPFPAAQHALVINLCSGLFMAFASFFLCRIIYVPVRISFSKVFKETNLSKGSANTTADVLAGFIAAGGALSFALCDSAWYSAVEAEVYGMSTFLSSLSLWVMTVWWFEKNPAAGTRLLVLVAYLTGLSLGVHQLNLLLIPVFGLIIFYRYHPRKVNPFKPFLVVVAGCVIIGAILTILIPGGLKMAGKLELFGVNYLGLPYNSGVAMFCCFIFIILMAGVFFCQRNYEKKIVFLKIGTINTALWMLAFMFLGFTSFGIIMIRSGAATPMNEGSPDNIFALENYIARDQYSSAPLLYGSTPYSRPVLEETFKDGKAHYNRYHLKKEKQLYVPFYPDAKLYHRSRLTDSTDSLINSEVFNSGHGYLLADYKFSQILTPELNMWFPRLTSRNTHDIEAYKGWAGMTRETMEKIKISEAIDTSGNYVTRIDQWGMRPVVESYRPTYLQNLRYFAAYQCYYMYLRYLFWNFIGRQNDLPSQGEIEHGNFITGFDALDSSMIGDTESMPSEIWKDNRGRNRYFGIPFIIGILGIIFLLFGNRRERRLLTLTGVWFIMTGLAIVVYLNQSPGEPRERDYTFLVSYMAFSMWISAGVTGIVKIFTKNSRFSLAIIGGIIFSLGSPVLMAVENFDDHDRRGRFEPAFYSSSLLDFELPSIIFSQGDNSTFPLWYAGEVLDLGPAHTPVDVTYFGLPSYIVNLKRQGESGIRTLGGIEDLIYGRYILTRIPADSISSPIPVNELMKQLYASDDEDPVLSSSLVIIPGFCGENKVVNLHDFSKGSSYLSFKHLMLLDIIASIEEGLEKKALYFPSTVEFSFYKPLGEVLHPVLFGKVYAPKLSEDELDSLFKISVKRELHKIRQENINQDHYPDIVGVDKSVRYRGEMIIAANRLLDIGDTILAKQIMEMVDFSYPYSKLLPGSFTMGDSTYYEGREYYKLLERMYSSTGEKSYKNKSTELDSLMKSRQKEWLNYYKSLTPEQRSSLSNRSRRLLINWW